MDMKGGILMTTYGVGVSRGKTLLFGLRQAVRSLSDGEGTGVLFRSGVPEGAEAEMASQGAS